MSLSDGPVTLGTYFVAMNWGLSLVAAGCYLWARQWNDALYWSGAVILTGSILFR